MIRSKAAALLPVLFNTSLFLALLLNLIILLGYGVSTPVSFCIVVAVVLIAVPVEIVSPCGLVFVTVGSNHDAARYATSNSSNTSC